MRDRAPTSIIEDGRFCGYGQGREWCVTGLDRNGPILRAAKAARPMIAHLGSVLSPPAAKKPPPF